MTNFKRVFNTSEYVISQIDFAMYLLYQIITVFIIFELWIASSWVFSDSIAKGETPKEILLEMSQFNLAINIIPIILIIIQIFLNKKFAKIQLIFTALVLSIIEMILILTYFGFVSKYFRSINILMIRETMLL